MTARPRSSRSSAAAPSPRLWRILHAADSPTRGFCGNLLLLWSMCGVMLGRQIWYGGEPVARDATATRVLLVLSSLVTAGYLVLSIRRVRLVREIFRQGETVRAIIDRTEALPGTGLTLEWSHVFCRYATASGETVEQSFVLPRRFARQLTSPVRLRIDRQRPKRAIIESEYIGR